MYNIPYQELSASNTILSSYISPDYMLGKF